MSFFHIKNENIPVSSNIHPLAVGKRVEDAYIGLTGSYEIEELCYGLEYHIAKEDKKIKDKIICAVIGYVNEVKGQDLLLRAIEKNERKWNGKIEFWVIGSISQKDRTEFEKYTCVRVWGLVEHKSLMEMYSEIDMVLCPSRHETMSVAVVEGMMHRKLCIISSETGNARYCEPFKNALIMENENVDSLSENIDWVLEHPDECKRIADAGFEVYDKKFRMESFEENVIRIVTKYCRKESLVE
jgi:glycosyltransferase involved in cell wall biosynthesis